MCSGGRVLAKQTSLPCNILVFQNEYSDQALALRMKSRIDDLIFKLRVRIGDEFFSGGKVVLAYPSWNTVFQRTYRMNFLPHPKKFLGEGGSGSICALNAQRTFLKGYNEEKVLLGTLNSALQRTVLSGRHEFSDVFHL